MIVSLVKRNHVLQTKPNATPKTQDEIYTAEFEIEKSKLTKPNGAFLKIPEIEGIAFFCLAAGAIFGHSVHATKWGGEFAIAGMIMGIYLGIMGRNKIKGVIQKWFSRLKSLKSRSVSASTGTNGLARSR